MMARIKSGEAASRRKLRVRLALERLTGACQESDFLSASMQHGIDSEPRATAAYEAITGEILEPIGFARLNDAMAGCSPDSLICGGRGSVGIKCPDSHTHFEYIQSEKLPGDYRWQAVHEMWVLGTDFFDHVSFDDRFTGEVEHLQYHCMRIERDEREITEYDAEARRFLAEVTVTVNEMKTLKRRAA